MANPTSPLSRATTALGPWLRWATGSSPTMPRIPKIGDTGAASGDLKGYLAKPKGAGKLPAVIVIHENRGLNPHIEDIARRLALENFLAFAPDALFPLGGYPGAEDKAREVFPKLDQAKTREDFIAAFDWLKARPDLVFIGLTATPGRKGMAEEWQDLVVATTTKELIDMGFLSRFRVFAPSAPDLSGVKISKGEFETKGAAGSSRLSSPRARPSR